MLCVSPFKVTVLTFAVLMSYVKLTVLSASTAAVVPTFALTVMSATALVVLVNVMVA